MGFAGTTTKRRKALFSWLAGWAGEGAARPDLFADRKAPWLDVAEFPGNQYAQEQKHRQADPNRERARHATGLGAAVAPVLQHVEQRKSETRQDADEGQGDEVFHEIHYRPTAPLHAVTPVPLDSPHPARRGRFWLVMIATVVALGTTGALGRWQLSRAAQKEALQAEIERQKILPPLDQAAFLALTQPAEAMHRPVRLRGLWLAPQTVYLDNRQMHGVAGFYVLTPFAIEDSDQVVMVQRGWIQRNFEDRTQLQPVQTPAGLVEIEGRIELPPSHLLELAKATPPAAGAKEAVVGSSPIRQNLDLAAFGAETRLPLRTELSIQQGGAASEGLQRDWPAPALGIERHYGYAFQWFGLAALVSLLYVWFQIVVPIRRTRRARRR
jgi:surfeit locus 1 family protein